MKFIPLSRGLVANVDNDDYEWLMQWKWYANLDKGTGCYYAKRSVNNPNKGEPYGFLMHREILGLKPGNGLLGDHIDAGNTLDNTRANLRIATTAQNTWNARRRRDSGSGYKGVSWFANYGKWSARICVNGKNVFLGYFPTPEDAYAAYCIASKGHHEDFSRVK